MKEKIIWIDYMKFIACILVMLGHYYLAFYSFCSNLPGLNNISVNIFNHFPKPFLNGNFWICVFCILSGMLVKKNIDTISVLIKEIILRYFRFCIPFFFANIFVFLIFITVGFSSHEIAQLYGNSWLFEYYHEVSLTDVIKNTVLLDFGLNAPLWMLRPLFIGNVAILMSGYVSKRLEGITKHSKIIVIVFFVLILLVLSYRSSIFIYTLATYFGFLLTQIKRVNINTWVLLFIIIIVMSGYYFPDVYRIIDYFPVPIKNVLFSLIFVLAFVCWKGAENIKSMTLPVGAISFWVYLLHWPVICSFSSFLLIKFQNYTVGYWSVLFITYVFVFAISLFATNTIDRINGICIQKISLALNKILKV